MLLLCNLASLFNRLWAHSCELLVCEVRLQGFESVLLRAIWSFGGATRCHLELGGAQGLILSEVEVIQALVEH